MNDDSRDYTPPTTSVGDRFHTLAKAVLSSVPVVGGAASELFHTIVTPPLEKRRSKWMEEVGIGLAKLEQNGVLKLNDIIENEVFISTLMSASQSALITHQKEKLEALKNAAINSVLPGAPEESTQQIFINLVDRYTEWHIRILRLFNSPPKYSEIISGALEHILHKEYPELMGHRSFYDLIWKELYDNGLVHSQSLHVMMSGSGLSESQSTHLGKKFLRFISTNTGDANE